MENKTRIDLWKEKREKIAEESNDTSKIVFEEISINNFLTEHQRDLIAMELVKMSLDTAGMSYNEIVELMIRRFNTAREDVSDIDRKLNKC